MVPFLVAGLIIMILVYWIVATITHCIFNMETRILEHYTVT